MYAELGELIGPWAPSVFGSFVEDDWRVLLLEDLGPKSAPPWSAGLARNVAKALAGFHRSTLERPVPAWVPGPRSHPAFGIDPPAWDLKDEEMDGLARLADDAAGAASAWLMASVPVLATAAQRLADPTLRHALLHVDVRSDNLRWIRGRLRLFDWPHVGVGPPEFDVAAFAQAVAAEGGPAPEETMRGYALAQEVDPVALDASVAAIAGYFVRNAWLPEIPELPRVRGFQRRQLAASLRWAARRLGLPEPTWTDRMLPAPVPT